MLVSVSSAMLSTMNKIKGAGLAANQIGLNMQLLVAKPGIYPYVMVNPEIINSEGSFLSREGCFSVPGYWDNVKRFLKIKVKYYDVRGTEHIEEFEDFPAAVIQHEIDHLNGVLFINHLSDIKKSRAKKKVETWKRRNNFKHKSRYGQNSKNN
jgi:peptide deformylase